VTGATCSASLNFVRGADVGPERSEAAVRTLLAGVLGSTAGAVGAALPSYTEYRLRNVERIAECADAKSGPLDKGAIVNLRVAHVVLEDGSYCDDELMASYLGGLLAGSRTLQGRDDRAVAWSRVVTGLSSLQIRAHYLLYREWAARLRIIGVYELGVDAGRVQATMEVSSAEFVKLLVEGSEVGDNDALSHSIGGLARGGLLDSTFRYTETLVRVMPSIAGLELYGWAQGLPGLPPRGFASNAQPFDLEEPIPRLSAVAFPQLPEHPEAKVQAGPRQVQAQRQARRSRHTDR
jgi:hypothetical protein